MATGSAGLSETVSWRPDLIVLDLGLPDLDGESLLRMIRAIYSAPVLIVTAHADEETTIRLLHAGADDYLIKPFSPPHLGARVEAVLRRAGMSTPSAPLAVGALEVDLASRVASLAGEPLSLSRKEFDLLAHLARRAGQVVSRRELLREVWHLPSGDDDQIRPSTCICRGCAVSSARPRRRRATCTPSAVSASNWSHLRPPADRASARTGKPAARECHRPGCGRSPAGRRLTPRSAGRCPTRARSSRSRWSRGAVPGPAPRCPGRRRRHTTDTPAAAWITWMCAAAPGGVCRMTLPSSASSAASRSFSATATIAGWSDVR